MQSKTATYKQSEKPTSGVSKPKENTNGKKKAVENKTDSFQIIRRLCANPNSLTRGDIIALQRIIGNRALIRLLSKLEDFRKEDEKAGWENQMKKDTQGTQSKKDGGSEGKTQPSDGGSGIPHPLKAGIANLSGTDLSDVRVHRNSDKPKQIGALAYTQGNNIYMASGQEKYLSHESWHVVQQRQGRVRRALQMKTGEKINDDTVLEKEADIMGEMAEKSGKLMNIPDSGDSSSKNAKNFNAPSQRVDQVIQRKTETTQAEQKVEAAEPEEIELKGMTRFTATKPLEDYLSDKNPGADISVRYGRLARGRVKITKSGDRYVMPQQAIQLIHYPFSDGMIKGFQPCLVLSIDGKGMLMGYMSIWDGKKVPSMDYLKSQLITDPSMLGLRGINLDKSLQIVNSIDKGILKFGINNARVVVGKVFSGTISFDFEPDTGKIGFSGSAQINIKGLANGIISLGRTGQGMITGSAGIEINLTPHFTGALLVRLDGDVATGEGKVRYLGEKLSGEVIMRLSDKNNMLKPGVVQQPSPKKGEAQKPQYVLSGEGDLMFRFTDWLSGTAHVEVDEKGNVTIVGQIVPQKELILFQQKDFIKNLGKFEVRASYGIPLLANVFVFANIGLEAFAKLGPAKLYKIAIGGTYSTDPEKAKDFSIQASLNISAAAGVKLRAEGGAGLEVLGHDVKAGVGLGAIAGISAYAEATPVIGYKENAKPGQDKKGEFFIAGELEIAAQPFFGLEGDFFVEVDSPWWSPVPDKKWTWPLVNKSYPLGSSFGITARVEHVLGSGQVPEVEFGRVDFSAEKFMTDLINNKTGGKKGQEKKQGKWNEKNSVSAQPPKKQEANKAGGNKGKGEGSSMSTGKPSRVPAASAKHGKEVDPNARMADGKTIKQHENEAVKRGKKPVGNNKGQDNKQKQDQLKIGLAALKDLSKKYGQQGTTRKELQKQADVVKQNHSVFKSINVVDGGKTWKYKYRYNPEGTLESGIKDSEDLLKEELVNLAKKYKNVGATDKELEPQIRDIESKFKIPSKTITLIDKETTWYCVYGLDKKVTLKNWVKKKDAGVSEARKETGEMYRPSMDKVPSLKDGEFYKWFNSLTTNEFNQVWADSKLRDKIEYYLRRPGKMHEWLMVSRAPVFKSWGIKAEQIHELRSKISDVKYVDPYGAHGKEGSTTAHNEILKIIDSSSDFIAFKKSLQKWAEQRLENGIQGLPEGLRL